MAVVENMSGLRLTQLASEVDAAIERHSLPAAAASELRELLGRPQPVFGASHVPQLKAMWGIANSFEMPLLPSLATAADAGVPTVRAEPEGEAAETYAKLAAAVEREVGALEGRALPQLMYSSEDGCAAGPSRPLPRRAALPRTSPPHPSPPPTPTPPRLPARAGA